MSIGGHQSAAMQTDVWLTPPEILRALGPFDLDPCAVDAPRPWPTAAHHYVRADNGLLKPWFGRIWLCPPYGAMIARWMARMAAHGCGTALVFARTETAWFFQSVWPAASALLFIEGRLNFHLPNGQRSARNAGAPHVLIAYGSDDCDRLAAGGIGGAFVPLPHGQAVAVLRGAAVTWRWLVRQMVAREGQTDSPRAGIRARRRRHLPAQGGRMRARGFDALVELWCRVNRRIDRYVDRREWPSAPWTRAKLKTVCWLIKEHDPDFFRRRLTGAIK